MEKTCSKCGNRFGCKNESPGCWCEEVKLPMETLVHLKETYDNCLCPNCLVEYDQKALTTET